MALRDATVTCNIGDNNWRRIVGPIALIPRLAGPLYQKTVIIIIIITVIIIIGPLIYIACKSTD